MAFDENAVAVGRLLVIPRMQRRLGKRGVSQAGGLTGYLIGITSR